MLEGGSIRSKLKKIFKGAEKAWKKFLKPALNLAGPNIGMVVATKTKNPEIGRATGSILISISVGKIFSSTDLNGSGSRLKVLRFNSNKVC